MLKVLEYIIHHWCLKSKILTWLVNSEFMLEKYFLLKGKFLYHIPNTSPPPQRIKYVAVAQYFLY